MSEIEKYYNGEIHVDFEEDKPLLTKEEAEEYYNKLWLDNKELIQENIARLDKKRFAQELMLAEKDKEIERLNNIINELEKYLIEEIEHYEKQIKYYKNNKDLRSGILDLVGEYEGEKVCFEDMLGKLQELKGSDKK